MGKSVLMVRFVWSKPSRNRKEISRRQDNEVELNEVELKVEKEKA